MHGSAKPEFSDKARFLTARQDHGLWFGLFLCFAACMPVLVSWAPQMTDYPSHLAGFKIMLDHGHDPWLARYYNFAWHWTGNLGAELLMVPLTGLFGLELAGRLIAGLIPFLTGLSILTVAKVLRGRIGVGALLAFAMIWSPSLLLGFLNFSLSLAMALFAFAGWVALEGRRWRPAVFIPVGFAVWLCHVSGWGVLGIMVFGYEWHRRRNWTAFLAPWPLFFPMLPMLAGMGSNTKMGYGKYVFEYKWMILYKAMRSHFQAVDIASLIAVVGVLGWALWKRRIDGRLGWAALIVLLLSMAMPRNIFGGDYADYRLVTTALLLFCLAIDWPVPRWGLALAAALFLGRIAVTTTVWYQDGQTSQRMLGALAYVPEGARVATAVAIPRRQWRFGPFEHLGSYAVVRRSAKENSNFALPDVHMLSMRDTRFWFADPMQRVMYSPGQKIDLRKFRPARHADYLWFMGTVRPVALPDGARILYSTPNSFLARLANRGEER
ncbi:hypothetical protein B2G71_11035 [Novosphingobium sp. PC22D]|uniref:hypothetical protein n=1 Tax=Novosphingobium sp. PC22D TaxID=1962403 RepID=UPI000BF1BE55|nr:hypothetical protein [Novosphingobium sp. PC22D]PEQ12816.1 hypothetical protein B2G71_11035 [Novosphingobium sp. PC22D]